MKPNLNQADLDLLKKAFATKKDLSAMEKRQDQKYASKNDVLALEKRIDERFDELEVRIGDYSVHVEGRLQEVEAAVDISHTN